MPKERFHILVADRICKVLSDGGHAPFPDPETGWSYLLGAVLPDIFFYDLPFFRTARVGRALHRFEGKRGAKRLAAWVKENRGVLDEESKALAMGLASHLLADGFLHPLINEISAGGSEPCGTHRFSRKDCHHWLESELESYWLNVLGPADGYVPLLRSFRQKKEQTCRLLMNYRAILLYLGVENVPPASKMFSCLGWQVFLFRCFTSPALLRARRWLIKASFTRYLGVLIVPEQATLCGQKAAPATSAQPSYAFCTAPYMADMIISSASRLLPLLEQF